jgi:hypothetical protein
MKETRIDGWKGGWTDRFRQEKERKERIEEERQKKGNDKARHKVNERWI